MDDLSEQIAWFQDVILPQSGALRSRLRRMLRPEHDLDDIVSETLIRAYSTSNWREIRSGLAFLTRIARNLLIDMGRRDAVVSFDFMADLNMLQHAASYDSMYNARDELRRLDVIIAELPPQTRRAFILRRVEGYSMAEIAVEMDLAVSTVEKHVTRALALLTRALARYEDDWGGAVSDQRTARGNRRLGRPVGDVA